MVEEPPVPQKAGRGMVLGLAVLALLLLLAVVYIRLRPQRCDDCGRWTIRPRLTRLAPGWRSYCPDTPLRGARPSLCPTCFQRLLTYVPAKDPESLKAVIKLLTDPEAGKAMRRAIQQGAAKTNAVTAPFPSAQGPQEP